MVLGWIRAKSFEKNAKKRGQQHKKPSPLLIQVSRFLYLFNSFVSIEFLFPLVSWQQRGEGGGV